MARVARRKEFSIVFLHRPTLAPPTVKLIGKFRPTVDGAGVSLGSLREPFSFLFTFRFSFFFLLSRLKRSRVALKLPVLLNFNLKNLPTYVSQRETGGVGPQARGGC